MNSRRKTAAGASPAASAAASTVEVPIDGYATSSFEVLPAPVMFDPAHIPALTPLAEVRASDVAVAMPIDGILQARRDLEGLDPEAQASPAQPLNAPVPARYPRCRLPSTVGISSLTVGWMRTAFCTCSQGSFA